MRTICALQPLTYDVRLPDEGNTSHKRKEGKQSDEQTYDQTEKASSQAFTQSGQHCAVPFAICDVALLDAVLCG